MAQIIEDGYGGNNDPSPSIDDLEDIDDLAELAFEQYEFEAEVVITEENYDLIRQVFIDAFIMGCRHGNAL